MNYTGFYTGREHLANDVGDGPHHLMDIPCDAFYITTCQHWYTMYQCGNAGRNCVTGEMAAT